MGWTYDQLLTTLYEKYAAANLDRASVSAARNAANIDWQAADDHAAIGHIIDGMTETIQYMANMLAKGYYGWNGSTYLLPNMLDPSKACPFITADDVPPVDMAAIIVAMLSANPDEVEYFVGLVDAYRQSIWNRPFNKDMFAALARGFMLWP